MNLFDRSERALAAMAEEPRGPIPNKPGKLFCKESFYKLKAKLYDQFHDVHRTE